MIIAVFGAAGAGKTTLITHLAKASVAEGKFVGIVSAETRFGSLQRELGVKVADEKSLKQAILDSGNIKKYFVGLSENIYILSMADHDDITSHVVEDVQLMQKFASEASKKFDVLFVDCTDRATDDLTAVFLRSADKIINIIESTPKGIAFFNAHQILRESFFGQAKEVLVLNKNIPTNLNKETAEKLISSRIDFVIPYFPAMYENALEQKSDKKYVKCVSELWRLIDQGAAGEPENVEGGGRKKISLKLPKLQKEKQEKASV